MEHIQVHAQMYRAEELTLRACEWNRVEMSATLAPTVDAAAPMASLRAAWSGIDASAKADPSGLVCQNARISIRSPDGETR